MALRYRLCYRCGVKKQEHQTPNARPSRASRPVGISYTQSSILSPSSAMCPEEDDNTLAVVVLCLTLTSLLFTSFTFGEVVAIGRSSSRSSSHITVCKRNLLKGSLAFQTNNTSFSFQQCTTSTTSNEH